MLRKEIMVKALRVLLRQMFYRFITGEIE